MDIVDRVAQRSVAARLDAATDEVRRLVEATYAVIERTGSLDPPLRAVLRESGCSNQAFYRHFTSKDDLLLGLFEDGRRRLAEDLRRRTAGAPEPASKVEAWVRGVLLQAADTRAATHTRPFVAGLARLEAQFPDELRQSRDLLVETLTEALTETLPEALPGRGGDGDRANGDSAAGRRRADALATYDLAFGAMQRHLIAGTRPEPAEVDHLVRYALTALGLRRAG